jgi:hypothetical protein
MDRKEQLKQLLSNTNALLGAIQHSIQSSANTSDVGKWSSYKTFLRKYTIILAEAAPLLKNHSLLDGFNVEKIRDSENMVWPHQKEFFDLAYSNIVLLKSLLEGEIGYAEDETHKLKDFIGSNLRKAIRSIPEKETEIQNALETLLVGRGMEKGTDYDRETGRVKSSGKECIPDFIFPRLNLCLEIKLSKSAERLRTIVDEVNADIMFMQQNMNAICMSFMISLRCETRQNSSGDWRIR